jgi:hypothetical protein
MARYCTDGGAAQRHDYARIWRGLSPRERDRRIAEAIRRVANGEELATIGRTWNIGAPALCMAMIAYAPNQWAAALVAQSLAQAEDITAGRVKLTRAQERLKLLEWRMKRTLRRSGLQVRGQELFGPCPACKEGRAYVGGRRPARCFACDWSGDRKNYLAAGRA